MPGKQTLLTAAVVLVAILLLAAAALFIYPMLTSGGATTPSGSGDVTPATTSSTVKPSGTIVIKETPAPVIPPTGVYVHINYLGGFKGSYGIPDMITTVPGNSGDRVWEVENATNSTVQATFEKLDGSSHELLVEIYKDGKALTSGTTTVGHGSVALSVDMVTGIAAAPVTSGSSSTAKTEQDCSNNRCRGKDHGSCRHDNRYDYNCDNNRGGQHHYSRSMIFLFCVSPFLFSHSFFTCRCLHCSGVVWFPVIISP